jgi:hypothetical protein
LEGVGVVEVGFVDELDRLLEIGFGLPGKPDDNVG